MTKRLLGLIAVAGLSATTVRPQQPAPGTHPRPSEPEPLYAKVKVDPSIPSYRPAGALSGRIQASHQDVIFWIVKAWADGFTKVHADVEFDIKAESTRTSISGLQGGAAQFAAAGRELFDEERNGFRQKRGVSYDPFPIAVAGGTYRSMGFTDAVAFFVHKDNPLERISLAQLDAMYSTTRNRGRKQDVKTWGQLGLSGEWTESPVILWSVTPPNGLDSYLREKVLEGGKLKDGIQTRETPYPMPYLVGFSRHSIGYAGFSYLPCAPNIKTLAIAEDDAGPYYKGSFDEVVAQKYPLSRVIYLYVHRVPGERLEPKLKEFLKFILSREGQQIVVNDGVFLPLPAPVVKRELGKLE
jgi:phosphate transport system substrate-binding protein